MMRYDSKEMGAPCEEVQPHHIILREGHQASILLDQTHPSSAAYACLLMYAWATRSGKSRHTTSR